jgi:hypothetical protein
LLKAALLGLGCPASLYERIVLKNRERGEAFGLLRALEAMARRILLIAAAQDQRPLEPLEDMRIGRGPAKTRTAVGAERQPFMGLPPKTFPVRFALTPSPKHAAQLRVSPRKPCAPENWGSAYLVAPRFEALIRVYADPAPHVMRLRQMLAQCQGPRRAQTLCADQSHAAGPGALDEPLRGRSGGRSVAGQLADSQAVRMIGLVREFMGVNSRFEGEAGGAGTPRIRFCAGMPMGRAK